MWKSISLSGWEYFIVWKDLGSNPMCVIWVIFNSLLFLWYDLGVLIEINF